MTLVVANHVKPIANIILCFINLSPVTTSDGARPIDEPAMPLNFFTMLPPRGRRKRGVGVVQTITQLTTVQKIVSIRERIGQPEISFTQIL
jgi:hypothetical protein